MIALVATNFWNPVGWALLAVGIGARVISWLFDSREEKLQRHKKKVTESLLEGIEEIKKEMTEEMQKGFKQNITQLNRGIDGNITKLCNGMYNLSKASRDLADECRSERTALNRRLLVRCGSFVGKDLAEEKIGAIARYPGLRTKFIWSNGTGDSKFCQKVGTALGEYVDGVPFLAENRTAMIANALPPAHVSPEMVHLNNGRAEVWLPQHEIDRAKGRNNHNVNLASELLNVSIQISEEKTP